MRGVGDKMKLEHQELEQIFCLKISAELSAFQYDMLQKEREEIYQAAYQIDSMINLYELLIELCRTMKEELLIIAVTVPELLRFLYDRWLEYKDSHMEDMQGCIVQELEALKEIDKELKSLKDHYRTERMEETA